MRVISIILCLWGFGVHAVSQALIDDFESGSLNNWTVLQGNGETVSGPAFNGTFAARLFKPDVGGDAQSLTLHNSFQENWGIYEMYCYADGPVSDVQFLFQYLDGNNYYAVGCNPLGTDNPEVHLYKVVNGTFQTLARIPPIFGLDSWFNLRVEHYCDGTLNIYIDDQLQIAVNDQSLRAEGRIALGAWGASSYFDDITFTSVRDTSITEISEDICSGTFYEFGNDRLNRTGIYLDTLQDQGGCDSIVRLDLVVHPHFLVSESDTICGDSFYIFAGDTLRSTGRYNTAFTSIYGCDSFVELDLQVFGGDTILEERNLCSDAFTLFNDDTIRSPGTYFQTVTLEAGCSSIFQLNVTLDEPVLDLGSDQQVCFMDDPNLTLSVENFDSVIWSDGSSGPQFLISQPGIYSVEGFIGSCRASDTIEITEKCETEMGVFVPNAFSPNGDGFNDDFKVETVEAISYRMEIYNRWGGQMFKTENGAAWDGTKDGQRLPAGVYLYIIELEDRKLMGDVMLLP